MYIPIKYIPKNLTKKDIKIQKKQLILSRKKYKKGKYINRNPVKSYKSKKSKHILNAMKIYNINNLSLNDNLSKKTGCSIKALNSIVKKGQGAYYSSGSRPNQTAHSWGLARLASSITSGKAAAVDYKILEKGCKKTSKALKLAKLAQQKYNNGTRRVKKVKI